MRASTSRCASEDELIDLITIMSSNRARKSAECRAQIAADSGGLLLLILRPQRISFRTKAGRSDPHPGVTPGVAEGAEEGGRSCPLRGLRRTDPRTKHAVNQRSNVVEPAAFR